MLLLDVYNLGFIEVRLRKLDTGLETLQRKLQQIQSDQQENTLSRVFRLYRRNGMWIWMTMLWMVLGLSFTIAQDLLSSKVDPRMLLDGFEPAEQDVKKVEETLCVTPKDPNML